MARDPVMDSGCRLTPAQRRVLRRLADRPAGSPWIQPGTLGWPVNTIDALDRRGLIEWTKGHTLVRLSLAGRMAAEGQ